MNYELVIGLETHVELATKTKIFCGCTTEFGGAPNSHCCPICIGLPGTMPKLNEQVVKFAQMAGLATNCEISKIARMDRKNYVYPDLPKAYQISQQFEPLCRNGHIDLSNGKTIRIERIHIEEDAGKLIHERGQVFIDYNRGGVPLIEIVSKPDFSSADEVVEYLECLQLIMRYINVSDCKMQEGSLRCDVNISVKLKQSSHLGTRTEIKNMNSFSNIVRAIEFESRRQIELIENGQLVVQQTLRFDDVSGETIAMRDKENANDYRYFLEPDLTTILTTEEQIEKLKNQIPELANEKMKRYVEQFGLEIYDAKLLVKYKKVAEFFEKAVKGTNSFKTCANLIITLIFSKFSSESQKEEFNILVDVVEMNKLLKLLDQGKIKNNVAKKTLDEMLDTGKKVSDILSDDDLKGLSEDELIHVCELAIKNNDKAVSDYLNGKSKALKSILGDVMKQTKGRADAVKAQQIIADIINKLK